MKIVNYNETTGKVLGWYDSEIHNTIPTPNKEVTDKEWQDAISINANYFDGTTFSVKDFRTQAEKDIALAQSINNAIQSHLDTQAKDLRYDSMMSARSYAGYLNAFQDEATKLASWASDCWVVAGQIEVDVKAGTISMPTVDEVILQLPLYV